MENKVEEQPTQECSNVQNTSGREPVTRSPFTVYLDDVWMPLPECIPPNCSNELQYLSTIDHLNIQQYHILVDDISGVDTRNEYLITNRVGEKVFHAVKDKISFQECCSTVRPIEIKIFDASRNEVIHISKPFSWQSCLMNCFMQKIEVFSPRGSLLGVVEQDWSIFRSIFTVRSAAYKKKLKIRGAICRFNLYDVKFNVLSMDGTKEIAKITKCAFDNDDYLFHIDFSETLNVRIKALLLSACFLI